MKVGDVYYRKIDNCECEIRGFFYRYNDGYPSDLYQNLASIKYQEVERNKQLYVLFTNDTFDTVDNLYTQLYLTNRDYNKLQKHSSEEGNPVEVSRYVEEFENADGLYSAIQIALDFPILSVPDVTTSYEIGYIESDQESYDGQHAEEAYWDDNDLVPNPGESKRKRFKLF